MGKTFRHDHHDNIITDTLSNNTFKGDNKKDKKNGIQQYKTKIINKIAKQEIKNDV